MPSRWREPQKPWAKKSPKTNVIARNLAMFFLCHGPVSRHGWNRDPLTRGGAPGRTGKQPDGSAKTGEVKLCTIWNAESLDEEGTPIRDEGSVTYSAALESACALDTAAARSPFAERVWREAARRRFRQASRTVVLGSPMYSSS